MKKITSNKVKFDKIKIEIDPEKLTLPDARENVRWEDDGGHLPDPIQMIDNSLLPFKPGDTIKFLSGHFKQENGCLYYIAEIEYLNR